MLPKTGIMFLLHLCFTSSLVLTLLQVGLCEAAEESIEMTRQAVTKIVKLYTKKLFDLEYSLVKKSFGPDVVSVMQKFHSEVDIKWGKASGYGWSVIRVRAIVKFVAAPDGYVYQSDCSQFKEFAFNLNRFFALNDYNLVKGDIIPDIDDVKESALQTCSGEKLDMDYEAACLHDPNSMIAKRFKIMESKITEYFDKVRLDVENSASLVKKECDGSLLNTEDIDSYLNKSLVLEYARPPPLLIPLHRNLLQSASASLDPL